MIYYKVGASISFRFFKDVCKDYAFDSKNVLFSDYNIDLTPEKVLLLLVFLICICESNIMNTPSHESERVFLCVK